MSVDPNKDRNDPMVPEFWTLGEDLQDGIRAAGYDAQSVEGIAVDVHDLLQAAGRIERELAPAIVALAQSDRIRLLEVLGELRDEFAHIAWHCDSAARQLSEAISQIGDPIDAL